MAYKLGDIDYNTTVAGTRHFVMLNEDAAAGRLKTIDPLSDEENLYGNTKWQDISFFFSFLINGFNKARGMATLGTTVEFNYNRRLNRIYDKTEWIIDIFMSLKKAGHLDDVDLVWVFDPTIKRMGPQGLRNKWAHRLCKEAVQKHKSSLRASRETGIPREFIRFWAEEV
jgi:hypothetical protein